MLHTYLLEKGIRKMQYKMKLFESLVKSKAAFKNVFAYLSIVYYISNICTSYATE